MSRTYECGVERGVSTVEVPGGDCPDQEPGPCRYCGTLQTLEHLDCGLFEWGCPSPTCENRSWWCVDAAKQRAAGDP